jgi:hypothetical protein
MPRSSSPEGAATSLQRKAGPEGAPTSVQGEHSLTIVFTWVPKSPLLRARLPNGAEFLVEPIHLHGKLGANLSAFKQAQGLIEKGEAKALPTRAPIPEDKLTICEPGAAYGVKAPKRKTVALNLDDLEIEI